MLIIVRRRLDRVKFERPTLKWVDYFFLSTVMTNVSPGDLY